MQRCAALLLGHKGFFVGGELSHISASAPNTEAMSRWDVGEEEYVRVVWTLWYKSVSLGGIKAPGHLAKHADTLYYKQSCRGETSNSTNNSTSQVSMLRKSTDGGAPAQHHGKCGLNLGPLVARSLAPAAPPARVNCPLLRSLTLLLSNQHPPLLPPGQTCNWCLTMLYITQRWVGLTRFFCFYKWKVL